MPFSFLNKVEEILQYICLVEVVGCTFILCLLGYYIIMVREIINIINININRVIISLILILIKNM